MSRREDSAASTGLESLLREAGLERLALDRLPFIVWVAGGDGEIKYINVRGAEDTGVSDPRSVAAWLSIVHPDDVGILRANLERYEPCVLQYRLRGRDGDYRWYLGQWTVLRDARSEVLARVGCAVEIDAQRRAQEGHRFLAEASETLASSLDLETTLGLLARLYLRFGDWCVIDAATPDGSVRRAHVEHAGDAALTAEVAAAIPSRGGIGPDAKEILAADLPSPALPADLAAIAERIGARSAIVVYVLGPDETMRVALYTARSGRTLGHTEFELAEELARRASHAIERAHLYTEAQRANEAKDVFLGTVSHELRGPLAAISMWTHVLGMDTCDDATRMRAVEAIDESVRAQARLIDDMLDLSRAIGGRLRLEQEELAVGDVLTAAVDAIRGAAEAKGLNVALASTTRAVVLGDRGRLVQVMGNLLANAVEFTPAGGRVDVSAARVDDVVRITVHDTGDGIAPSFLPHLFKPFRKEDPSLTRARGGLGIGLAVAKQIVAAHGGTIRASSAGRGEGAVFEVELPIV